MGDFSFPFLPGFCSAMVHFGNLKFGNKKN